jgi:hypothetical protein
MSRNTTTGKKYEKEIELLLNEYSDHDVKPQANVGLKRNGGKHYTDVLLNSSELISLKFQCVQGSVEEKVPFEFMKLQDAIDDYGYKSATIVLAGPDKAWKWKDYYLSDAFSSRMKLAYPNVRVISHNQFIQEYLYNDINLTESVNCDNGKSN